MQNLADQLTSGCEPHTRMVCGEGVLAQAGEIVKHLPARRVLLVTDAGLVAAGHAGRLRQILLAAGLEVAAFEQVQENPTTRCVDACLAAARFGQVDALVALGGGSAIDTAKGANFLLTNGGQMKDYWGTGKASQPMLPLVAIPTTAGTGSEMQCSALIADETTHQKMACLDPKAAPRVAIFDPELTLSQPHQVTACTGLDAIAHTVETMVTRKRHPASIVYSYEAFLLAAEAFPQVLQRPQDVGARGQMLLAAAFAGVAIENSMLGAAHAAANPLTARLGIPHGHAVSLMMPHVVRCNAEHPSSNMAYTEMAQSAGIGSDAEGLAIWLENLRRQARLPCLKVAAPQAEAQIQTLAAEAAKQWTATFNPRQLTEADFSALYVEAWLAAG
jgi:alcohol dehydrogenase